MTPEFDAFVAPARRRRGLLRLFFGLVIGLLVYLGFIVALVALVSRLEPSLAADVAAAGGAPSTPGPTLFLMLTFAGMALGAIAAAAIHRRGPATLFGPRRRVVGDFGRAAGVVLLLYAGFGALALLFYTPEANLPVSTWLRVLPLALAGVLLQVTAEEMVFRGYLMQQLAARFRSALLWFVAPALLFGAGHYVPGSGAAGLFPVAATTVFGLVAADLTRVTGSLGAAIGFHFANNVFALLVVSVKGSITGLALFVTPFRVTELDAAAPMILADILGLGIVWLLLRRALRR